jgi:inosine-uridine nucleoside N-ribohydrolase
MRDTIKADPGEITVVAVGPLTNLAVALVQRPELAHEIREIIIMGGAAGAGNVTPDAEFNFHVDPHAAKIVFESGALITMLGLDITRQARALPEWLQTIAALNTPVARCVVDMLAQYGSLGGSLHDVLAVMQLLRPELMTFEGCRVEIETDNPVSIGKSWVTRGVPLTEANAQVGFALDARGFRAFLAESLGRYGAV